MHRKSMQLTKLICGTSCRVIAARQSYTGTYSQPGALGYYRQHRNKIPGESVPGENCKGARRRGI